ncbi:hypothetical protein [Bradyrhizobium elkanii]|uniref:hypothetical protein n=1 Tax=Bradyrhizobium elkanii TaxID=29448 RepID=UPI0008421EDE|nr:hypothetical protein [Bradyrhizobium elkanii]ODM77791.1 hypothetical protein A6452_34515 [Bradyrhizobium elkanii]ODM81753.1 hypothetical protein A6X20_19000 [Bradyrhizobium elkanii]
MDRLTALVAIAHLKLRLELLERHPQLLEAIDMIDIKRPIELAGMRSRLARAKKLESDIGVTGQRFDRVLDKIDDQHKALQGHAGELESNSAQLEQLLGTMLAADNGGPNDGETGSTGSEVGQVITSKVDGQ